MDFKTRLKHYREKAGYKTAKDFAKKLGIPYPTYVAYENTDREPKFNVLIQISQLLNVTTDELLGNKPDKLQWIKGIVENNGFRVVPINSLDLKIIQRDSLCFAYPREGPFFEVINLEKDRLGYIENFVFSSYDLIRLFRDDEKMDQNGAHEKYLQIFREEQLRMVAPIMYEIYTNPELESICNAFLTVNPRFFDLWFEEFEEQRSLENKLIVRSLKKEDPNK